MNPKVEEYFANAKRWKNELLKLRSILLDCGLEEDYKWRNPCYTYRTNNIVIIGEFKDYCAFSFFKGVLLADTERLLHSPGENSQSVRMFRFTSLQEIVGLEATIKAYVYEALEVENAGLKVEKKDNTQLELIEELQQKMFKDEVFKVAFESLTPGRQRAYNMYFASAKQSKTRETRIESYTERILKGKGMLDCICGHSKRMPNCDGSHKEYQ